jgi:hypothetical protein
MGDSDVDCLSNSHFALDITMMELKEEENNKGEFYNDCNKYVDALISTLTIT